MRKNIGAVLATFTIGLLFVFSACNDHSIDSSQAISNHFVPRWVDSAGNIYIADSSGQVIRKVTNGIITTIAGGINSSGNSGDNSSATSALFYYPLDVVAHGQNLYIADCDNNSIRKIDLSTGIISLVAGTGSSGSSGDGTSSAELHYPESIAVDSNGIVYIGDSSNYAVRKLDPSTGVVTTVAGILGTSGSSSDGSGLATGTELGGEVTIAVDASNNLYIADGNANVIYKVDPATNMMQTIAGTAGSAGSSGDNGSATSALLDGPLDVAIDNFGNIYFSDNYQVVRRIDASSGIITTYAGQLSSYGDSGDGGQATSATLYYPDQLAFDTSNNLYIDNTGYCSIRMVDANTHIISRVVNASDACSTTGDNGSAVSATVDFPFNINY